MRYTFTYTDCEDINITITPISPDDYSIFDKDTDMILYNRIVKDVSAIKETDIIVYYGHMGDKLLTELALRFLNKNRVRCFNLDILI
jgi:hypothetical protein